MRGLFARLLVCGLLALATAAAAQPGADPPPHGPYVGDETHRTPLGSDVPFPEGVTPRERPVVAGAYRHAGRPHGRRTAVRRRHGGGHARGAGRRRRRRG